MGNRENIHSDLVWYKRVALEVLWGVSYLIGCMPRWFRFGILRPFIVAILRLIGYRKAMIIKNLTNSFPEKSEKERAEIMRASYNTLAEAIVTTISLAASDKKQYDDVVEWVDLEGHISRNKGQDWVAMAAHFGSWEYYPMWGRVDKEGSFLAVYHPLRSEVFEHFYRRMRSRLSPNVEIVPMKNTVRRYVTKRKNGETAVLGLISDQSPLMRADSKWIDFLNQKTLFVEGGERIAMKFGLPVYFVDSERIEYGRYRIRFVEIYDGKEQVEEGVITHRYAEKLEAMIRRSPELWMWSHNRWRHTPEKQAKKFGATTLK